MTDFSPEQEVALAIAHGLVDAGVPVFSAAPNHSKPGEFLLPNAWQTFRPHHRQVEMWRPGWALAMVTGVVFDVLDVDPRNGGLEGWTDLQEARAVPQLSYGEARTPSDGFHRLIGRTHLAKTKAAKGVDLQAGDDRGEGRGFVYIAPTVRVSKYGPLKGQPVAYRWDTSPDSHAPSGLVEDQGMVNLREIIQLQKAPRRPVKKVHSVSTIRPSDLQPVDEFWDEAQAWTPDEANRAIQGQLQAVRAAREGEVNETLGGAARLLGRFVAGGHLAEDQAVGLLTHALEAGGVHSDAWNIRHGKGWTAATVIGAGLANGADEPWEVGVVPAGIGGPSTAGTSGPTPVAAVSGHGPSAKTGSATAPEVVRSPADSLRPVPPLCITSAADSAYWLQNALGVDRLSGFFLRNGAVAHTPRVDELGYVEAAGQDDNGPAQIQDVTAPTLAAKIQYLHRCYKLVKDPEGDKDSPKVEVPALFPLEAAKRAVDAPEAMTGLRPLNGITHTPMVRSDGTILDRPGYDEASGYLFLPTGGLRVAPIPAEPSPEDVAGAVALLDEMTAQFPWESKDDRANYYGFLLTPLMRLLTPPSYKMFGIGAHQPGSGKTLLADAAVILHGGVTRSEMPEDEAEMRKQTTSILATTSAPVVLVDNVTGVLRSSVLAGLLTAGQAMTDRELGTSRSLTTLNDRTWVVTGNNLSLGGDLVRRTIVIGIDPNMANPEAREFAIPDLKAWVKAHRAELLRALLIMIRAWVVAGRPLASRTQSDSFATWEASVAGILSVAGVPGDFDRQSGQRAAVGGDDDGLAGVLETIWDMTEGKRWTVNDILEAPARPDEFIVASRDWLPSVVLDKLARSEPGGRKSFGRWIMNRAGRWVTGMDGRSYVFRNDGKERAGTYWKVERSE